MSATPAWNPLLGHYKGCHACGEGGLGLRVWAEGDIAHGEIALDGRHAGSPHHAHGGVIAELFDDVLGTVSMIHGLTTVTGTLEIRYRAPGYLGRTYQLSAWLTGIEGRRVFIEGEMTGPAGLVAEASGTWITVDPTHYAPGDAV